MSKSLGDDIIVLTQMQAGSKTRWVKFNLLLYFGQLVGIWDVLYPRRSSKCGEFIMVVATAGCILALKCDLVPDPNQFGPTAK